MPLFRRMLVALSGQPSDAGLLEYAALLSRITPGLSMIAVHVVDPQPPALLNARHGDLLEAVRNAVPGGACDVLTGDVLDTLLDATVTHGCDIILLGHKQCARRRRSLARRLAMKAPCSVWMVPDGFPPSLSNVLAPIDFSPRSADSLRLATALAEAAGLDECCALHVYFNQAAVTFDEFDKMLVDDAERAFSLFIAPIDLHGVYAKPLFVEAPKVAPAILRIAGEGRSDLIVMGTRGRSASAAVLLGSETEHTLMSASVPVLAVKHFGARMRLIQALREERVRSRTRDEWYI